jgi:hypothetical protein
LGRGDEGGSVNIDYLPDSFTVQYRVQHGEGGDDELEVEPMTPLAEGVTPGADPHTPVPRSSPMFLLEGLGEEDLDTDHDNASLQLCSMEDVVAATTPPGYAVRAPRAVASPEGDE